MAPQDTDNQDQAESQHADASSPTGVGAMLMATRMRIGDDLRDVAKTLHIRYIYLQAIEDGRYDDLPGTAYALGFIRSYADYLGLDIDEVVRRFKNEGATQEVKPSALVFPVPIPESSVPGGAVIFIALALAIVAYGGWYLSTAKDGFLAELISPLPERLSTLLPDEEKRVAEPKLAEQSVGDRQSPQPNSDAVVDPVNEPSPEVAPEAVEAPVEQTAKMDNPVPQPVQKVVEAAPIAVPRADPEIVPVTAPVTPTPEPVAPVAEPIRPNPVKVAEPAADVAKPAPDIAKVETVVEPVAQAPVKEPEPVAVVTASETPVEKVVEATAPVVETVAPAEPEAVTEAPKGRVFGAADGQFRIEVTALKNSWIQVRDDVANTLILTRLLRAGDRYRVPDRKGLKLLTGNAGALEIRVDGNAVPPVGDSGAVRRSVALDPDLLVQGQAVE